MVEVEIGGVRAIIEGTTWTQGSPTLLRTLQQDALVRPYSGYDPFPALTIATEAITRYNGRIVRQQPPEYVEGRVY